LRNNSFFNIEHQRQKTGIYCERRATIIISSVKCGQYTVLWVSNICRRNIYNLVSFQASMQNIKIERHLGPAFVRPCVRESAS
jgi:hypothetical protein